MNDFSEESAIDDMPAVVAPQRKPEFGDKVHYVDNWAGSEPFAELDAVVMVVFADRPAVNLRVFDPGFAWGHFDAAQVEHDAEKKPGTWHFPEE